MFCVYHPNTYNHSISQVNRSIMRRKSDTQEMKEAVYEDFLRKVKLLDQEENLIVFKRYGRVKDIKERI